MDLLGIAALLAVLIILVVVMIKRSASKEKTPALESEKPPVIISVRNPEKQEALEESPEKITIYEFSRTARVKVCAFCDGENDSTATYCCICGKQADG